MHGDINRSLPCSIESEVMILGATLVDNALISQCVGVLEAADFYSPVHRKVFEAMLLLFEKSQPIDPILIGNEIKKTGSLEAIGGVTFITNLSTGIPFVTDLTPHIDAVRESSRKRKLIKICGFTSDDAWGDDESTDSLMDRHEQLLSELRRNEAGQGWKGIGSLGVETANRLARFAENPNAGLLGITTGFKDLDARTSGFEKGDLIILAGRPSMGKTALSLRMAYRASMTPEKPVVAYFSLEMSDTQLAQRLIATEAGVDLMRLRRGQLSSAEWGRVEYVTKQFQESRLKIDETAGLNTMQIKSRLRQLLNDEGRLDLVIIDHLGKIKSLDARKNRHEQLGEITNDLKETAKQLKVPVVTLSQLNREPEKRPSKKPQMSDVNESGRIEQDADVIMFIFRKSYYFPEDKDAEGKAEIISGKVRNGPTGSDMLAFTSHFARFDDYAR